MRTCIQNYYCAIFGTTIVILLAAQPARAVVIDSTNFAASAHQAGLGTLGLPADSSFTQTSIPTSPNPASLNVAQGGSFSDNTIEFSQSGGQTTLSIDMSQERSGGAFGVNISSAGLLFPPGGGITFTVDTPTSYVLSGDYDYSITGPTITGQSVATQFASLTNTGDSQLLFSSNRTLAGSSDFDFILGDSSNGTVSGSLSGILAPGTYLWAFSAELNMNAADADSGASATGNFTLVLTAVPEPSSAILLAVGGLIVGIAARRRRAGRGPAAMHNP